MEDEKELKDILKKVDDTELVPNEDLKDMDFYQLAYYMQTLNAIDALGNEEDETEDDSDERFPSFR